MFANEHRHASLRWGHCACAQATQAEIGERSGGENRAVGLHANISQSTPKKKKRLPPNVQRIVNNLVHMVLHHWSRIATRIGVSVQKIRVIMEDHGQSEVLIGGIVLSSARETLAPLPQPNDKDDLSTAKNGAKAKGTKGHRRRGSLANLQSIHNKVSKTASTLWSSAVGYGVDHVVFTLTMSNVDAVQPLPLFSANSDNTITTSANLPHLSSRTSSTSMSSAKSARTSSFTTFDPINSLLNFRASPDAKARSYEKIATIDTATTVKVSVGFAANHDILAEDNIRADVQVGTIHASIDALEKAQKIIKEQTPVHKEDVKAELQQPQHRDSETEPPEEAAKKRKDNSLLKVSIVRKLPLTSRLCCGLPSERLSPSPRFMFRMLCQLPRWTLPLARLASLPRRWRLRTPAQPSRCRSISPTSASLLLAQTRTRTLVYANCTDPTKAPSRCYEEFLFACTGRLSNSSASHRVNPATRRYSWLLSGKRSSTFCQAGGP